MKEKKAKNSFLLVTSSFPTTEDESGNAGGFVLDFALALQARGHTVTVLTPQISRITSIQIERFRSFTKETSLSHLVPKKTSVKLRMILLIASGSIKIFKLQKQRKFDRVLCFWALPSGLLNLPSNLISKVPMDVWLLGSDVWAAKNYPFGERFLNAISRRSRLFLSDGNQLSDTAFNITKRRAQFLPSGRAVRTIDPIVESLERYILFVGRLHPNKGVDLFIRAYINCISKTSDMPKLYIYGTGPLFEELQAEIISAKCDQHVFLCGVLNEKDLPERMHNALCVAIPSRIESIPLILGQAARYSKEVLLTNVGDMGSLAKEYQLENICEPTVESIEERLLIILRRNKPIDTINLRKLSNFLSLENSVDSYLKLIQNEAE